MRISSPDGSASATFCLTRGGRLASLLIEGREFLVTADDAAFGWGAYPMVPYAGRVRRGSFSFEDADYTLPITMGAHAIHGTAWDQVWTHVDPPTPSTLSIGTELGEPWPFGGQAVQRATIADGQLDLALDITAADRSMPVLAGWHPWFRRRIAGAEAQLHVQPTAMFELDDEAIPTGELIAPPAGPWDNCFHLAEPPSIEWPGVTTLDLSSSHDEWVIYNEPDHALCVEPQTDAPDSFNRSPLVLSPGETLTISFSIAWAVAEGAQA